MLDKNSGGNEPTTMKTVPVSQSGYTGTSDREDIDTMGKIRKGPSPAQYSIDAQDALQVVLEVCDGEMTQFCADGLCTSAEAERIVMHQQQWQEVVL